MLPPPILSLIHSIATYYGVKLILLSLGMAAGRVGAGFGWKGGAHPPRGSRRGAPGGGAGAGAAGKA
jgi:hypothetical protein